jgi:formate hydrogenlyase subunit 6/NADH:ubiquinone oxidoreductase subunit I
MKLLMTKGFRIQKGLRSTDRCTGCGTCQKVCPTGNISVEGNKVKWGDKCVLCLACFHWCPQEAIQADKRSEGIARYHHPQVTANDIACRQE